MKSSLKGCRIDSIKTSPDGEAKLLSDYELDYKA